MRIADIEVGAEYAHREGGSLQVSRVLIREKLGGGRLRVKILEAAAGGDSPRRGASVEVTSRSLVCAWRSWPELAAAGQTARDEAEARIRDRRADFDRERVADAGRPLPDGYDSLSYAMLVDSVADLRDWPVPALHCGWRMDREQLSAAALRVLVGLPVNLARDLLAAAELDAGEPAAAVECPDGSVGAVLGPLAPVLTDAMEWPDRGYLARRIPDGLLSAANDFVEACTHAFPSLSR
ncbi:hypothetical protein [Actinoplanes sp. NPDC051851]|uniref:hypothetical protein n=1 Tax=Actinoplanes sp. NPDC051851 TaxID=3154753 RepID=UPI00343B7CA2